MGRSYRTLSLSLPPAVFEALWTIGKTSGRTGARVAAEIVLRAMAEAAAPTDGSRASSEEMRRSSWCCRATVTPVRGQLVVPESAQGERRWLPVVVLLCETCGRQMHGREYEGWISSDPDVSRLGRLGDSKRPA